MVFCGIIGYIIFSEPETTDQTLADAEAAMAAQNLDTATSLIKKYLKKNPESLRANLVAGDLYIKLQEPDKAFEYYKKTLQEENPQLLETYFSCSRLAMSLGRAGDGEEYMRAMLEIDPNNPNAHKGLFELLRAQGRNSELAPHFMATIRRPETFDLKQLLVMAAPDAAHMNDEDSEFIDGCLKAVPEDPLPTLGKARGYMESVEVTEAIPALSAICRKHPDVLTAQSLLGDAIVRYGTPDDVRDWLAQLPDTADEEAGVWLTKGRLALANGDKQGAARCFWEGLKRDSINASCAYQLGRTLGSIEGHEADGLKLQNYARELHDLTALAFTAGPQAPQNMKAVVDGMLKFGRVWEAAGWCYAATRIPSEQTWAVVEANKITLQLRAEPPFILPEANPANSMDLSEWPVPANESLIPKTPREPLAPPEGMTPVTFKNQARAMGIEFRFNHGASNKARMFEFSGGGANVLDFDRDGWPDFYLTQGATWPLNPSQDSFLDTIYRNNGGTEFEDVGSFAIDGDNGYSQGAAVGDYDNDGFPDIFLGNIGANRFYRNNGDGTFSEVDLPDNIAGDAWTIGTMVADITGDGAPDIYAVNYLGGDDVFDRVCPAGERNVQCPVGFFPAADDQFLPNDGQWGFGDDTNNIAQPGGKGMGITTFRQPDGSQTVFVSNDTTPNFLFRAEDGTAKENALQSGVAVGVNGHAQSCMGIATADINHDGLMDLFVTNFSQQPNNLFTQSAGGMFVDTVANSGLREVGYSNMGWGAQFLDANLDGHPDLMVANGGLEDLGPNSGSAQRVQFFQNIGDARFLDAGGRAGGYFRKETYTRALARNDWNRDGLPDVFATHKGAPHALLTNTTEGHGDSIRLTLVGTGNSSRDAVGAVVTVTSDQRTQLQQVTAGDGFQCSNQKQLLFGLPESDEIKSITVTWPSGEALELEPNAISRNTDLVLIEGSNTPLEIPR